jgi:hypothetical protein
MYDQVEFAYIFPNIGVKLNQEVDALTKVGVKKSLASDVVFDQLPVLFSDED